MSCSPQPAALPESSRLKALTNAPLHQFAESDVDFYLKSLDDYDWAVPQRVQHFAKKSIGQPYKLYLLGEGSHESYDADPLYCLSASDCVTFVEHVYALALSHDWQTYLDHLMRLRYKAGKIGMLSRNHFTEADWNMNNAWAFEDVTDRLAGGAAIPMRVAVDRAAFFKKYGIGQDIPVQVFETTYIRAKDISRMESRLEVGDIIEFVRGTSRVPYVGHMGLIADMSEVRAMLIHSAKPAVREQPLREYVHSSNKIIGIKILRYRGGAVRKN